VIVSAEAPDEFNAGDEIEIDLAGGSIHKLPAGPVCQAAALDPRAVELLNAGGLIPYLKKKHAA
jgi:3-isopropylmalate/(R)-2-methylmalate dehydratase small subunit